MRTLKEIDAEMGGLREERDAITAALKVLNRERDAALLIAVRDRIDADIAKVIAPTGIPSGEKGMGT